MAQTAKNLPAMQGTRVRLLGLEDPRRRKWLPSLVFLLGKSHGQKSLVGYNPWGCKELDTTEQVTLFKGLEKVLYLQATPPLSKRDGERGPSVQGRCGDTV